MIAMSRLPAIPAAPRLKIAAAGERRGHVDVRAEGRERRWPRFVERDADPCLVHRDDPEVRLEAEVDLQDERVLPGETRAFRLDHVAERGGELEQAGVGEIECEALRLVEDRAELRSVAVAAKLHLQPDRAMAHLHGPTRLQKRGSAQLRAHFELSLDVEEHERLGQIVRAIANDEPRAVQRDRGGVQEAAARERARRARRDREIDIAAAGRRFVRQERREHHVGADEVADLSATQAPRRLPEIPFCAPL